MPGTAYLATCPDCDWTQEYRSRQARWAGRRAHVARNCEPRVRGNPQIAKAGLRGAATTREQAVARDRAAVVAAGFPVQRTEAEWVAHPYALDDLLRVLGGTPLKAIEGDRKREKIARGAA